jgi:6-phosphogluconate dehydrogenase
VGRGFSLAYEAKGADVTGAHSMDSNRRTKALAEKGILFVGSGVSGGQEGVRAAY